MAAIDYTVNVNTTSAQASLTALQNKIAGVTSKFEGIKSAIAGLAFATGVKAVLEYANSIKDVSEITGIAIQNVVGFTKAVSENNGTVETGQAGLIKFVQAIGEVQAGSASAQDAFKQVGISLNDLRTLSEQDLLKKALAGLNNMSDSSQRLTVVNTLLGKSFRGVNLAGLANDYSGASASSIAYVSSIKAAAEVQNKLEQAVSRFKLALLQSLEPMANFLSNIKPEQINKFVDAIIKIGAAAGGFVLLSKVVSALAAGLAALATVWLWFSKGVAIAAAGLTIMKTGIAELGAIVTGGINLFKNFGLILENLGLLALGSKLNVLKTLLMEFIGFLGTVFTRLGAGFAVVLLGLSKMLPLIGVITTVIGLLNFAIKAAFDIDIIDIFLNKLSNAYDKFKSFIGLGKDKPKDTDYGIKTGTGAEIKKLDTSMDAKAKAEEEEKKKKLREMQDAYAKMRLEIKQASIEFGKTNIDISNQINLYNQLIGKSKEEQDIIKAQEDIYKRSGEEVEKLKVAKSKLTPDQKRQGLDKTYDEEIKKVTELAIADADRIGRQIQNSNKLEMNEQLRLFQLQQQITFTNQLKSINDEMATMTMTTLEKKYYDIETAAKAAAKAAIEAEEARIGRPLTDEEKKGYNNKALEGVKALQDATKESYDKSREWSTGWKVAFNDYVENATNAAQQAQNAFATFTNAAETAFDQLVRTGKISWDSLISDMVITFMKADFKRMMAGIMPDGKGASGGGGILKSIGSWLSGGFAGGGVIPAGSYGRVGEHGPEYISGPATITPMNNSSNGVTNVTYNISAVDARSFQQLVAANPEFIHAVATKGARSLPGGR